MLVSNRNVTKINREKKFRYVYILEIDNHGNKSRFFGRKKIYYVGQTSNLSHRITQHLNRRNSRFLTRNFKDARRRLVFVKTLVCDEWESIQQEKKIKAYSVDKKKKLIESNENDLVTYVPCKVIILRKIDNSGELAFKLNNGGLM